MLRLPRSTNVKNYLEIRLDEWANWFKAPKISLDNTHVNILHRIKEYGFVEVKFVGARPEAANAAAEEIELWVKDMAMEYPDYADALRYKYFYKAMYGSRKRSVEEMANKRSVHYRTFETRVQHAKLILLGRIKQKYYIEVA